MVKCLIIDDEKNARDNLSALIEKYCPQLEIAGFAVSGLDGLRRINELKPDAIFLDVHMSDMDGFSVLGGLDNYKPMVVFVTAFDRYAMKLHLKTNQHQRTSSRGRKTGTSARTKKTKPGF